MHFSFWHPFAYLSCSKSLLFVVAFCCETPMFWLCYCLLCVCCVCVRMLLYVVYVCGCREMLRIRTVACTLFVCFVFWGWRCFFLKARANLWLLEQIESIRWLADLGLNRRLKFYLWPSFHALRALGTLVNVLANFLKRYPTNKIQAKKIPDNTSRCDVSWAGWFHPICSAVPEIQNKLMNGWCKQIMTLKPYLCPNQASDSALPKNVIGFDWIPGFCECQSSIVWPWIIEYWLSADHRCHREMLSQMRQTCCF